MHQEEIDAIKAKLHALKARGKISDRMVRTMRDDIAKAMAPLPPTWEWQHLRQLAGLTAADMSEECDLSPNRIRYWETGKGVADTDLWVDYAIRLQQVIAQRLEQNEAASIAMSSMLNGTGRVTNSAVIAQMQALQSTSGSLAMWLEQRTLPCSLHDVTVLHDAVQAALASLRKSERILRQRIQPAREVRRKE